ncbi:MAG: T9SS type A sorting domain-containing protein [Flavobacteriales bacterium]
MRTIALLTPLLPLVASAQMLVPTVITPLNTALNETSGLVVLGGEVWTQLDSGNPNALYNIDPASGEILRTVTVMNATNVDWEDIAADDDWLYIGDFGNNGGDRINLRVYRVALTELLDPGTTEILADTIRFAYALQTDFTAAGNNNDWDCEAMIAVDDSLFLFSKNWVTNTSYLYALSATPGDRLAERRDTIDAQGLITGATYDPSNGAIALVGYTDGLYLPFVWRFAGYPGHAFFQGIAQRNTLSSGITQMEGIAWAATATVYLSNEQSILNGARLWELALDLPTGIFTSPQATIQAWPSPNDGHFTVAVNDPSLLEIWDARGRTVWKQALGAGENAVQADTLATGLYTVRVGPAGSVFRIAIQR